MVDTRLKQQALTVFSLIVYGYLALFGVALAFASFVRSASPFYFDTISELLISVVGIMFSYVLIRGMIMIGQSKQVSISDHHKKQMIAAVSICIIVALSQLTGLLSSLPNILDLLLTGGFQIGRLFTQIITSVFVDHLGLGFVQMFFVPVYWLFGVIYWLLILVWFWPEKKKVAKVS